MRFCVGLVCVLALGVIGCSGAEGMGGSAGDAGAAGVGGGGTGGEGGTFPVGFPCGGAAGWPCPEGSFCRTWIGTCGSDFGGCAEIPVECVDFVSPVCGCDGQTYASECLAAQVQVGVDHAGPCPAPR
jgi:hypothetical protein